MERPLTTTTQAVGAALTPATRAKINAAAQDFEAFYITQFLQLMKSTNEAEQFNGGVGEEMFRKELYNQLGKNIAASGGFGVADTVAAELIRQQEGR